MAEGESAFLHDLTVSVGEGRQCGGWELEHYCVDDEVRVGSLLGVRYLPLHDACEPLLSHPWPRQHPLPLHCLWGAHHSHCINLHCSGS